MLLSNSASTRACLAHMDFKYGVLQSCWVFSSGVDVTPADMQNVFKPLQSQVQAWLSLDLVK